MDDSSRASRKSYPCFFVSLYYPLTTGLGLVVSPKLAVPQAYRRVASTGPLGVFGLAHYVEETGRARTPGVFTFSLTSHGKTHGKFHGIPRDPMNNDPRRVGAWWLGSKVARLAAPKVPWVMRGNFKHLVLRGRIVVIGENIVVCWVEELCPWRNLAAEVPMDVGGAGVDMAGARGVCPMARAVRPDHRAVRHDVNNIAYPQYYLPQPLVSALGQGATFSSNHFWTPTFGTTSTSAPTLDPSNRLSVSLTMTDKEVYYHTNIL